MNTEMQVLKLNKPGKFTILNSHIPELGDNDLLVKFKFSMLCGSDYPKFTDNCPSISCPLPTGMPIHECVGEIILSNSKSYQIGDTVLAMPKCDAGLSDYFIANDSKAIKLQGWKDEDLKYAPLSQPAGTILNAIDKIGNIENKKILVFGLGGIGTIFCNILRIKGANNIIAIDPNEFRRTMAKDKLDIISTSRWNNKLTKEFDVVIDAVGQTDQEAIINNSINSAKNHGKVVLFGIPTIKNQTINIYDLIRKNLTIIGVINPYWEKYLKDGVNIVQTNLNLFRDLLTHEFPLSQAESAFKLFGQKDTKRLKILLYNDFS